MLDLISALRRLKHGAEAMLEARAVCECVESCQQIAEAAGEVAVLGGHREG